MLNYYILVNGIRLVLLHAFIKRCVTWASLSLFVLIFLPGCLVGPNFKHPAPPKVKRYTANYLPKHIAATSNVGNAGRKQILALQETLPIRWWELFHSPELNALIIRGIKNSPNLTMAAARLKQAQEDYNAQVGSLMFPSLTAVGAGQRQRSLNPLQAASTGQNTSIGNLFSATLNISYTLDVFGGLRRQLEVYKAQVDYREYLLGAAYLSLTSNIAATAINIASIQEQLKARKHLIKLQENQLGTLRKQFNLGAISNESIYAQVTLIEQARALLPPLEKTLAQNEHALTTLVGVFPEEHLPQVSLRKLILPHTLPVTLPSNLVRQRPDVQAAEELMRAANAQIGVATAQYFPQITLSGYGGWQSLVPSALFSPQQKVWNIAGQLSQAVFNGGALTAQKRSAVAAYEQAFASYQDTVLRAFQNVADVLRAIDTDARLLNAQARAENAAQQSLDISQTRFRLGSTSYLALLQAQQQFQQARILRIQAQAARYSDTVALFQALGGSWWKLCSDKKSQADGLIRSCAS